MNRLHVMEEKASNGNEEEEGSFISYLFNKTLCTIDYASLLYLRSSIMKCSHQVAVRNNYRIFLPNQVAPAISCLSMQMVRTCRYVTFIHSYCLEAAIPKLEMLFMPFMTFGNFTAKNTLFALLCCVPSFFCVHNFYVLPYVTMAYSAWFFCHF